jgi:transcriptional regulator with XRE-family HTH domain
VRTRREALRLSQRELAYKIGVQPSHVACIENGRRKPSLRLVGRMADVLGFDRQELLVLARPEAKALIGEPALEPTKKTTSSWQRFTKDRALLARYHVTNHELRVLEHLNLLGTVLSAKDFIAILTLIRDIPEANQARLRALGCCPCLFVLASPCTMELFADRQCRVEAGVARADLVGPNSGLKQTPGRAA